MGLATSTTSFECKIGYGLARIILNRPDRGNPIDGDFCREFSLGMAEISERDDVRAILISARGKLFSVGGDLVALGRQGEALPVTIKTWTADLHAAIVRMVRMRAPVVAAVQRKLPGGSGSLFAPRRSLRVCRLGCLVSPVPENRISPSPRRKSIDTRGR